MSYTSRFLWPRVVGSVLVLFVVVSASMAVSTWINGRRSGESPMDEPPRAGLAPPFADRDAARDANWGDHAGQLDGTATSDQLGRASQVRTAEKHGTVPASERDREEMDKDGDGIRPIPLPLSAVIPQTRPTWPNVRVDNAVYAPEETGIAIDPQDPDRMVAVAQGSGCYYFVSDDGGVTWTEGVITDPYDLGDSTIAIDAAGTFYYGYIGTFSHSGIFVTRSTNGGVTWQPGVAVLDHNSGAPFEDKEAPVCDLTEGPYAGSLYIAWTQFDAYGSSNPADSTRVLFSYSRDQAATFASPIQVSDRGGDCIDRDNTVEGAVPAVGPDGTLSIAWAGPRGIEFDRSTDGGLTWGTDTVISDIPGGWDFGVPGIYRCNGLPQTTADFTDGPYSGRIYVLWSDQRNGDTDVFLLHSDDGGTSWSPRKRVNGDPVGNGRDQFFPWMSLDPATGHLYIVFYDRRETTGNATEVWLAVSTDGGETFSEEGISQSPFTPSSSVFFGDYIGIAAQNGRVRPFWMRLDGNQMSAWTALVDFEVTEIGDSAGSDGVGGSDGSGNAGSPGFRSRLSVLPNPTSTEARIFAVSSRGGTGNGDRLPAGAPRDLGTDDAAAGSLRIFAADGRLVRSYSTAPVPGSGDFVSWDLRDQRGDRVPSGSYWVEMAGGERARVVVMR